VEKEGGVCALPSFPNPIDRLLRSYVSPIAVVSARPTRSLPRSSNQRNRPRGPTIASCPAHCPSLQRSEAPSAPTTLNPGGLLGLNPGAELFLPQAGDWAVFQAFARPSTPRWPSFHSLRESGGASVTQAPAATSRRPGLRQPDSRTWPCQAGATPRHGDLRRLGLGPWNRRATVLSKLPGLAQTGEII